MKPLSMAASAVLAVIVTGYPSSMSAPGGGASMRAGLSRARRPAWPYTLTGIW